MRIGIFTDSYHPAVNGITHVVSETRRELNALGHEVYVLAPSPGLAKDKTDTDTYVLRIPAIKDLFYEDQFTSIFFPPTQLKRIRELKLDVILFLTPGQIGVLGVYAALKNDIPLVSMYCTDLYEYVRHYPSVMPGVIALMSTTSIAMKSRASELRSVFASLPRREESVHWSQKLVAEMLTLLHNRCAAIVAPSEKVKKQLQDWGTAKSIHVIPTGIELPPVSPEDIDDFKNSWDIKDTDKVILSVGRMGSEKNLELVINSFDAIKNQIPVAKLLLVGNSNAHSDKLKALAANQANTEDILFTGKIDFAKIAAAYYASDVFAFPSMTDTQGLVLHEAAEAGLPLVVCDGDVSEVIVDGVNGFLANNDINDFTEKVSAILADGSLRRKMGNESKEIVAEYSAEAQARKMLEVLQAVVVEKSQGR